MEACCTCATLLSSAPRSSESEKPLPQDRRLECCGRVICGQCMHKNPRFARYCPYCQISDGPSALPQGLREPPSYTSVATGAGATVLSSEDAPPPYSDLDRAPSSCPPDYAQPARPAVDPDDEKAALEQASSSASTIATTRTTTMTTPITATTTTPTTHPSTTLQQPAPQSPEDTLHILDHTHDTIPSLSLRYGIPAPALRLANRLTSDHLLAARRAILIPGGGPHQRHHHHQSPSSLDPAAAASDEARKARIRRWMVATKVPDYDVAVLYLEQAGHDLDAAVDAYFADEAWERENPNPDPVGGRSRGRGRGLGRGGVLGEIGSWWAGQAGFLRRS